MYIYQIFLVITCAYNIDQWESQDIHTAHKHFKGPWIAKMQQEKTKSKVVTSV